MITSKSETLQYQTALSNGKIQVFADTTEDKGGHNAGFRPHELLEAALAACLNMHVRMYAEHHQIHLDHVQATVCLDRSIPDQAVFGYSINFDGSITDEQRQLLFQVAKTCPVSKTLSRNISIQQKNQD